jgi:hypothetical protein
MAALVGVNISPKSSGGAGGSYTAKIPLDLLAQDGVPPEEGDTVSFSVDATVQSVDAEYATVKITAVNGEPVAESAADETAEDQGAGSAGGPPQPGGQAGGAAGAGGRGFALPRVAGVRPSPLSPATLAMGAALKKRAKGQSMPF